MKQYFAAYGAPFNDEQAQEIGSYLDSRGVEQITPEELIELGRDARSPLHPHFEWDDERAAALYRKKQAGNILNHLIVKVGRGEPRKAFHNVRIEVGPKAPRRYVTVGSVSKTPEYAEQVISKAFRELMGWKQRYAQYRSHFGKLFSEIELIEMTFGKEEEAA